MWQSINRTQTLNISYQESTYSCFLMGNANENANNGRVICSCGARTVSDFNMICFGPWNDWNAQYINWLTIGF